MTLLEVLIADEVRLAKLLPTLMLASDYETTRAAHSQAQRRVIEHIQALYRMAGGEMNPVRVVA